MDKKHPGNYNEIYETIQRSSYGRVYHSQPVRCCCPAQHINRIPEKFVCHLRYKFSKPELTPGRPSFQIGHHMINLGISKDGGHRVKLPDGPSFSEPESEMALNKWIDLVIEYELGKIRVVVNGKGRTYEHEKVTIINPKANGKHRFTFKGGPECEIIFDSVRIWECN